MGIFSFINTGMQNIASWWSDRQAVKSTDACIWFVVGAVVSYMAQPGQQRRRLPLPGTILLREEAYEDRSSYDKAVAEADLEWTRFWNKMKTIKKKARKMEKEKKRRDERRDKVSQKVKMLCGDGVASAPEQNGLGVGVRLELEQQGLERARTV